MTVSLAGCFGGEDGDSIEENPIETLDDWQVYSVTSSSDLPECNDDTNGRLYYVEADGGFQVCKTSGWEGIEISGANGTNGLKALISSTSEPSGNNCANGGIQIEIGVDDNDNEVLEASEIDQTQYICNGNSSSNTMPVSSSNNTMLTSVTPPGSNLSCDAGGRVISHGLDNGDGGGVYANGVLELGEVDTSTTFCSRTGIGLLKDIVAGGENSNPGQLTAVGNTLYFTASDYIGGNELWKSDGTASGTVMVKNINRYSSSTPSELTAAGNTLYFTADDGPHGHELWKSDGTANGTVMVKDIRVGTSDSNLESLTAVGNTLYFRAQDGTNGYELWKSDGTASGTVMVKDINSGGSGSFPDGLTAVGNILYFAANDGTNGHELWKSDGTANGTVMVKDINIGPADSIDVYTHEAPGMTAVGNTLYFSATDGTNGFELWKSDGTANGTMMVKDIYNGYSNSYPDQLTAVGNTLYFQATGDFANGSELWKSDGTASGTVMVKDINSEGSSSLYDLTAVGNTLYFRTMDRPNGEELWKSDGTAAGTVLVKDIWLGSGSSYPSYLTAVGNTLYFSAAEETNGIEVYFDGFVTTEITYS